MSSYVVDASIVVQELIQDTYTVHVRTLFANLTTSDLFYVPEFCLIECTNVLWKQIRFHGMPQSYAEQLTADLIALPLVLVPVIGLLPTALKIGATYQLAVYDSLYIALAEKLGYPLITIDSRQEQAAIASKIMLKPITDF